VDRRNGFGCWRRGCSEIARRRIDAERVWTVFELEAGIVAGRVRAAPIFCEHVAGIEVAEDKRGRAGAAVN